MKFAEIDLVVWKVVQIALGMCIIALAGCAPETCEELAPQIVESINEEREDRILELYGIKEIEGTRKLECTANAKLSSGRIRGVKFSYFVTEDGLHEVRSYEFPYIPPPPTPVPFTP